MRNQGSCKNLRILISDTFNSAQIEIMCLVTLAHNFRNVKEISFVFKNEAGIKESASFSK